MTSKKIWRSWPCVLPCPSKRVPTRHAGRCRSRLDWQREKTIIDGRKRVFIRNAMNSIIGDEVQQPSKIYCLMTQWKIRLHCLQPTWSHRPWTQVRSERLSVSRPRDIDCWRWGRKHVMNVVLQHPRTDFLRCFKCLLPNAFERSVTAPVTT